MPLKYETLVGDMGSALSWGQRQRVLFARPPYRNPRVLVMDEGTAYLDPISENNIANSLRELPATRLVSAHRATILEAVTAYSQLLTATLLSYVAKQRTHLQVA